VTAPTAISVCIVCHDEADRLAPCLESVSWADEVLVLDLESTDGSAALARKHGATVLPHAPVEIVEPVRNVVADHASGTWILVVDPDERVGPGLAAELRRVSARVDIDAVVIPRMNYDFGYPPSSPLQRYEPQLRMYRKDAVSWPGFPNALPAVPEDRVLRLPPRDELVLVHDRNRNITEALDRVRRYAPAQARAMVDAGEVFSARAMLLAVGEKVYRHFIQARAFREGVPGVMRAGVLVAFHVYVWAAFWHESGAKRTAADDHLLRCMDRVLNRANQVGLTLVRPGLALRRRAKASRRPQRFADKSDS
jgi:glycosyltransferase involved in cell wall biosynthesis